MKVSALHKDLFAATTVLLVVAGELILREMYYRAAGEMPSLFGVAAFWMVLVGAAASIGRGGTPGRKRTIGRLSFLSACGVWLVIVGKPAFGDIALPTAQLRYVGWAGTVAFIAVVWLSLNAHQGRWALVTRAVVVGASVFVASQLVFAALQAPTIHWPQERPRATSLVSEPKSVTVFLLLDELNANAAGPIAEALRRTGREVRQKTLTPVGDGTAKVIPAMFARRSFRNAKPCGLQTICSGKNVLDFSKVVASRPDIDVVGFYGPYCAMQGLRSCAHASPSSPLLDGQRWRCAALRRSSWLADMAGGDVNRDCADLGGRIWSEMVSHVEHAVSQAPVWRDGGFLFAHVPLPHPPGEGGSGSLGYHYKNSLARATALVDQMVERLVREPQLRFTIVVFSDHPLRASVWCQSSSQYRHNGCPFDKELVDDKVPLIVGGDIPSSFDSLVDNSDVFRLADQ